MRIHYKCWRFGRFLCEGAYAYPWLGCVTPSGYRLNFLADTNNFYSARQGAWGRFRGGDITFSPTPLTPPTPLRVIPIRKSPEGTIAFGGFRVYYLPRSFCHAATYTACSSPGNLIKGSVSLFHPRRRHKVLPDAWQDLTVSWA